MQNSNKSFLNSLKANSNFKSDYQYLFKILNQNPYFHELFIRVEEFTFPNWYICAGAIPTVIWNLMSGYRSDRFMHDIDIIYFDSSENAVKKQNYYQQILDQMFSNLPVELDLKNQAYIHLYYKRKLGISIKPFSSPEEPIRTWLSVTAIGIKIEKEEFTVYSPFGLGDLFSMTVRPNKMLITEGHYKKKTNKWKSQWPDLTILPWN